MASAISSPTSSFCASISAASLPLTTTRRKPSFFVLSNSLASFSLNRNSVGSKWIPELGRRQSAYLNGLRHRGVSTFQLSAKLRKKGKRKAKGVYASLFGVGAPEALVIGVVALLVFGPKGLAEVARTLGKTLRAFQPTIRELQEVSRDFKSTLEKEIGLDEVELPLNNSSISQTPLTTSSPSTSTSSQQSTAEADPNGSPSLGQAYSSEDYLKITEEQLKASATISSNGSQSIQTETQDTPQQAAAPTAPSSRPESET